MKGFVKLNRDIQGTWIHKDPIFFKAWCDILFNVNWEAKTVFIGSIQYNCGAGESLNSLDTWAYIFGRDWNKSKVRRFFKRLTDETLIDTQNERQTTRLKLLDSASCEELRHANETQTDTQMKRKPTPTKELRIKELINSKLSEPLKVVFEEYLAMRKQIRKPLKTGRGINSKIKRLEEYLLKYGEQKTIECVNASIDNEWKDIQMDWFNNLNGKPNGKTDEPQPETLDLKAYYLQYFREVDLKHAIQDRSFERWTKELEENKFRLGNIAKAYKNKTFTTLLLFELCYMPLGNRLGGSNPQRKLESLIRIYNKFSDYNKNHGDMRQLFDEWRKNQSL